MDTIRVRSSFPSHLSESLFGATCDAAFELSNVHNLVSFVIERIDRYMRYLGQGRFEVAHAVLGELDTRWALGKGKDCLF